MNKLNNATAATVGFFGFLLLASAVPAPAYAESWTEEVTVELNYLGTDLSKQGKEYSKRMDFSIHQLVTRDYDVLGRDTNKALKAAKKEWGDDHLNTQMAVALVLLSDANLINMFGGDRGEAVDKTLLARQFAIDNLDFPGSYYVLILADITAARLFSALGDAELAKEYFDKAIAAMKEAPGLSNSFMVQSERDYLL